MSFRKIGVQIALLALSASGSPARLAAQDSQIEIVRHVKTRVEPVYPDLARKMNLSGAVKVEVLVGLNGTVKEAKVLGGHPVLASAALEAARKWRFEPATMENSGIIDFKFEHH